MRNIGILSFCLGAVISVAAAPVTFRVNLNVAASEGRFDPAADIVEVRGAFNAWGGGAELTDENGDKIFEGTVDLGEEVTGQAQEYKFVYIKTSDGSVVWESINNRSFTPTGQAQTLDTVFFNNDEEVSRTIKGEINFAVDMSVQTASGNFNKAADEVWVRGNRMGWGAPPEGLQLFEDAARPGIYTNSYRMDSVLTGELIEYKYTIFKPENPTPTVWEDGANKTLTFDGTETDSDGDTYLEKAAGPVYFNGIAPADALPEDTRVIFSVNMQNAQRMDGTPFDPGFEGVWVNGNFANWWAWGNAPVEYQLVDDGTSGDEVAGDLIYSLDVVLPRGAGKMLDYKYAIDSLDNEAGFADNHVRYVREAGEYRLPTDVFGQMVKETPDGTTPDIGSVTISRAENNQVRLNWTGAAGVRLQRSGAIVNGTWEDVAGTAGVSTITVPAAGNAGFFRLFRP